MSLQAAILVLQLRDKQLPKGDAALAQHDAQLARAEEGFLLQLPRLRLGVLANRLESGRQQQQREGELQVCTGAQ